MERWNPVPNHEGFEVSDQGRVRSLPRLVVVTASGRREACQRRVRGCMLRPLKHSSGHLKVGVYPRCSGRIQRHRYIHQMVLEAFVGPCPPGQEALHLDGNPANNRWTNLKWGTRQENILQDFREGKRRRTLSVT